MYVKGGVRYVDLGYYSGGKVGVWVRRGGWLGGKGWRVVLLLIGVFAFLRSGGPRPGEARAKGW